MFVAALDCCCMNLVDVERGFRSVQFYPNLNYSGERVIRVEPRGRLDSRLEWESGIGMRGTGMEVEGMGTRVVLKELFTH